MKIRVWSDLHLEFSGYKFDHIWKPAPEDKDIVLILSGDISTGKSAFTFIEALSQSFKYVLYICGNHEFYEHHIEKVHKDWVEIEESIPNFHFLNNDQRILDGVRFIGGTMWTSLDDGDYIVKANAHRVMNDYKKIIKDGTALTPDKVIAEHDKFMDFLTVKLEEEFDGPTVVMSHHSPGNVERSARRKDLLQYAYYAEIEQFIGNHPEIKLWTHGHTHNNEDYMINETRVICNPFGYYEYDTNRDFKPDLLIEV